MAQQHNEHTDINGNTIQASNAFTSTSSNGITYVYAVVVDLDTGSTRNVLMSEHDTPAAADQIVNAWKETTYSEIEDARPAVTPTLSQAEHKQHDQKIAEYITANPADLSMKSQYPDLHAQIHPTGETE